MKRMLEAILVVLALALSACASTPVVFTDFDRSAQFGNYHTYAWSEPKPALPEQAAPPMPQYPDRAVAPVERRADQAAPLMQQRIVDAIDAHLAARGWRRTGAGDADVIISTHVDHRQEYRIDSYYPAYGWGWGGYGWGRYGCCGWGPGWGWGGGWDSSYVRAYTVGTLVVDMFDARTHRAIWTGVGESTVQRDPARQIADLDLALQKMFADFPPGSVPAARAQ
jgi:hypothetical protein